MTFASARPGTASSTPIPMASSAARASSTTHPSQAELSDLCRQAAAFTAELFPGGMEIRVKNDPEIPDDLYFVFAVRATGSVDDVLRLPVEGE